MVQIFLIEATGETKELGIGGKKTVGEFLDTKEVFIIVDDISHKCFLWKGKDSRIRSKFIGAKKSQDVRGQVGLSFKVEPVDESEEPEDFKACLKNVPVPGYAKEIREEGEGPKFLKDMDFTKPEKIPTTPIVSGTAGAPAPATAVAPPAPAQKAYATSVDNVGPMYTGKETSSPIEKAAPAPAAAPPADYTKIMDTLTGLETPMGYEREMVIIGSQTFSIVEKATMFLGQRVVKKAMEPIGSLPEGVFFAEGYAPRVLCENGKVLAIEFLKKVKGAADRIPAAARSGSLTSSKPIPALPAATARPSAAAATAAPVPAPATPMAATTISAAPPKQAPPPPRLPGQQHPAPATGSEGSTLSLKDHLAKMGSQDLKKAFGIRVGKKEDDKKK